MSTAEYLEFLDWTARSTMPGKRGATLHDAPPILERVGLPSSVWLGLVSNFGKLFHNVAGKPHEIASARSRRRRSRFRVRTKVVEAFAGR